MVHVCTKTVTLFVGDIISMGGYDDATLAFPDEDGTISTGISLTMDASEVESGSRVTSMSDDEIFSNIQFDTASYSGMKKLSWLDLKWDVELSRIDLVAAVHGLLSSMLWMCAAEKDGSTPENKDILDSELLHYVDRISSLYPNNCFHNWEHACHVTLSAAFLVKEYHENGVVDKNPFVRFITVVS